MKGLDEALENLGHVRTRMRQLWLKASDAERGAIEADEHRISRSMQLIIEVQQKLAERRSGRRWGAR